jgi:hypothetical protein
MMVNVKLTCSWCDDETLYKRFKRCYLSEYNFDTNIQFTNSNKFDWLVVINHPRYHINFPKEKTIGVIMEPSWTKHYELKYTLEQSCKHILSHKKESSSQYIYYPGLLPYHMDYNGGKNLDYYINTTFKKTKKCSMVVSYNQSNPHDDCIYVKRTNFAKQILNTDLDIDIYGNEWENSGIKDSRIKGQVSNKKDALIDYEFSIAIENCLERDYFTEKITDCILTDATPIYYGCPDIEQFFNSQYVLSNLNDTSELIKILRQSNSKQTKKLLATKFNLYVAICKYIKQNAN